MCCVWLFLKIKITWVGSRAPTNRRWFATLASESFCSGRFDDSRTLLHAIACRDECEMNLVQERITENTRIHSGTVEVKRLTENEYRSACFIEERRLKQMEEVC